MAHKLHFEGGVAYRGLDGMVYSIVCASSTDGGPYRIQATCRPNSWTPGTMFECTQEEFAALVGLEDRLK